MKLLLVDLALLRHCKQAWLGAPSRARDFGEQIGRSAV